MRGFFIRFVVSFFALGFTAAILPGIDVVGDTSLDRALALGAAALVLGVLNAIVRPILILLTLPITILTLGLFIFVLNGIVLWLTSVVVPGFVVSSFGAAILGTLLMTIISAILNRMIKDTRED
ncbi:MAG: phage holin family protein [Candidatus Eisenbacteria bacterium]|nr:phage holin family protein [Candidatus Eisenbacteria bacterium]